MQEPKTPAAIPALLRILGGFSLADGAEQELSFPYDKAKLLLAMLVLQPAGVARQHTAELLWPQSAPSQARANLRRALFDLKQVLVPLGAGHVQTLESDKKHLRLAPGPDWWIDARRFAEALPTDGHLAMLTPAQALAIEARLEMYRGPLLADVSPGDTEMDAWIATHREALAALYNHRRQQVIDWHQTSGRHDAVLRHAQAALALDPLCEPALQSAMRALAFTDRPAAIALFERFQDRLQSTLGVDPSERTLALLASLRSSVPTAESGPDPVRRRLVVLVCELDVAHGDPELLAQTLEPLQAALADLLNAHGAHVRHADGGELVAFFGHPVAIEQAPRRALVAAQAMRAAVVAPLSTRIGLHAGWAYSSQPQSSPDSGGLLTRRARALATSADPNEILLSHDVSTLVQRGFRFQQLDADRSRLAGVVHELMLPRKAMVGREAELGQLLAFVHQSDTAPSAAYVQGDPGIGKTRLLEALAENSGLPAAAVINIAFHPEAGHTPYGPFIADLRRRLTQQGGDLDAMLAELGLLTPTHRQALSRLVGGSTAPVEKHKREDEELLCAVLGAGTPLSVPRLVLIEDIHWADPSSLDLLARCLHVALSPFRLVLSSRAPLPSALSSCVKLSILLQPLDTEAMSTLLRQLAVSDEHSARTLLARAEGVPLFAEELARSLRSAPDEPLPASLWDLLAARLDAVEPGARRLAQSAAAIGIEFDLGLLHATHRIDSGQEPGTEQLGRLAAAGLLDMLAPQPPGTPRWRFRHALMRDAVYASITLQRRVELHRRIADALLGPCEVLAANRPELLAHHLSAAGDPLAAHYWLTSGKNAAALSGHTEACQAFERGLQVVAPDADKLALALWLALGGSQLALQGYGSAQARYSFGQALMLADGPEENGARFQALWGLWLGSRSGQDDEPALASAHRLVQEAQQQDDPAAIAQAAYALGNNLFFAGQLDEAANWLKRATALASQLPAAPLAQRFGEHGGITAQAMLCWLRAVQGRAVEAADTGEAALKKARDLGHAQTHAYALAMLAISHRHLGQPGPAARRAQELLAFATAHELQLWQAVGNLTLGWAMAAAGDDAGLDPIKQAVAASAQAMPSTEATFIAFFVDALLALGRAEEALPWIMDAMSKARQRHETYLLPGLTAARTAALAVLDSQRAHP